MGGWLSDACILQKRLLATSFFSYLSFRLFGRMTLYLLKIFFQFEIIQYRMKAINLYFKERNFGRTEHCHHEFLRRVKPPHPVVRCLWKDILNSWRCWRLRSNMGKILHYPKMDGYLKNLLRQWRKMWKMGVW